MSDAAGKQQSEQEQETRTENNKSMEASSAEVERLFSTVNFAKTKYTKRLMTVNADERKSSGRRSNGGAVEERSKDG